MKRQVCSGSGNPRAPRPSEESESVSRSVVSDSTTPWTTVAHQALLSMEFSRQDYWTGEPFASPGDLPHPGIEPGSASLQADSLPSEPPGKPPRPSVAALIRAASCLPDSQRSICRPSSRHEPTPPTAALKPASLSFPWAWSRSYGVCSLCNLEEGAF